MLNGDKLRDVQFRLQAEKRACNPITCVTYRKKQLDGYWSAWRIVPLRIMECGHSPTGFNWGYGGSGPAQLAYAILRVAGHTKRSALLFYQEFKRNKIVGLNAQTSYFVTFCPEAEVGFRWTFLEVNDVVVT